MSKNNIYDDYVYEEELNLLIEELGKLINKFFHKNNINNNELIAMLKIIIREYEE